VKTLIAYATNHGATKHYAEALARQIAGAEVVDLKQQPRPDLSTYDAVIVGTAIYYGKPLTTVKEFCASHLELLSAKRIGLFVCSMVTPAGDAMKTAFPAELLASAAAIGQFGGELIMKKLSFGERLIARAVTKGGGDMSNYSEEPIAGFVAAFSGNQQ
jgi:menaquinone-dependent protoporphyrinogen oxidase